MNHLVYALRSLLAIGSGIFGPPIVHTKNGVLEGTFGVTRNGREYSAFKGIPYALPPVGPLRFQPPEPAASWSGVRSAKRHSSQCLHSNVFINSNSFHGSEDCLYLNVYTPKMFNGNDPEMDYPVMVWIHGGGWVSGSGDALLYSPKFLLDKNIVLVTINYRLGALGFLSTGDDVLRGNQALKDQVQALRWVQENIAAFGGDRNSVTIFGESAGGASSHFLMLSPLAKGLFHRVISQSGSARGPRSLNTRETAKSLAQEVGAALNCSTNDSRELRDCLLTKSAVDIQAVDQSWKIFGYDPLIPFKPVIEVNLPGAFLAHHPKEILKARLFSDVPWIFGVVTHEGCLRTAPLYGRASEHQVEKLNSNFSTLAPVSLAFDETCPREKQTDVARRIRHHYLGDRAIDEFSRSDVIDMYTDALSTVSAVTSVAEHHAHQQSPIYFYVFGYRGPASWSLVLGDLTRDHGVCHLDDLLYLFPQRRLLLPITPLSANERRMIDIMTSMWYNFAKTGNPTPEVTQDVPTKWHPVTTEALEYFFIHNPDDLKMSKNYRKEYVQFWKALPCTAGLSI